MCCFLSKKDVIFLNIMTNLLKIYYLMILFNLVSFTIVIWVNYNIYILYVF